MKKKLVIVGGGFAGVNLARNLESCPEYEIILVDKNNYNFFPPLLYQVATGFLEPSSISYPFRTLFRGKKNVRFWLGHLKEVKLEEKKLILSDGELTYDYLVLATGTRTNYFGLEDIRKHAIPMKTLDDALNMRNTLLQRMEMATKARNKKEREEWVTMVIAGGGPTGVEVAGMFAEMRASIISKEYPELADIFGKIYLVNSGETLLEPFSEKSQKYTIEELKRMGVELVFGTRVSGFDGEQVSLNNGSYIKSKNLIWATGVKGIVFPGFPSEVYERGNRMKVDAFNKVEGLEDVYALGDISLQKSDENFPEGHPQLAQVAIQQGKNMALNFKRMMNQRELQPFRYTDKGIMAIIGRSKAVADMSKPHSHFDGLPAWLMWSFIHLFSLINRYDRLRTFYNWAIAYFTKNQDLRMIIRPRKEL